MRLGFISTMGKKTPAFLHFPALVLNGLTISVLMTFAPSAPPGLMTEVPFSFSGVAAPKFSLLEGSIWELDGTAELKASLGVLRSNGWTWAQMGWRVGGS